MGDTRGQKNCILEPYHLEGKKNHLLKLRSNLGTKLGKRRYLSAKMKMKLYLFLVITLTAYHWVILMEAIFPSSHCSVNCIPSDHTGLFCVTLSVVVHG